MGEPTFTLNEMFTLGCVLVRVLKDACIATSLVEGADAWEMDLECGEVKLSADEKALVDRALASS